MSHWLDELRSRQDVVAVPRVWLTIAVSILIHLAILFLWVPRTRLFNPGEQEEEPDRLRVEIAAAPTPTPPPPPPPQQAAPRPAPTPPRTIPHTQPPPVVRMTAPQAPVIVPPPPPPPPPVVTPPVATPPPAAPATDLAAFIAARRRERGEPDAPPVEDEAAKFNRSIAANLPTAARGSATQDKERGGGIFQIKRMTYDDAAFEFYGWNTAMGRKTPQLIEVRKGMNSDMRIAVVRRMIVIIREYEKEDFTWTSPRLGHSVTLSARLSDNTGLENFLMHEFFDAAGNLQ